jgi:hypothetical protein
MSGDEGDRIQRELPGRATAVYEAARCLLHETPAELREHPRVIALTRAVDDFAAWANRAAPTAGVELAEPGAEGGPGHG